MKYSEGIRTRVGIEAVYAPYVAQQTAMMRVFQKDENLRLPLNLDYDNIFGLSMHEKAVLKATNPESIGQARRIEGMTPSGCLVLLTFVRNRRSAAEKAIAFEEVAARKREFAAI